MLIVRSFPTREWLASSVIVDLDIRITIIVSILPSCISVRSLNPNFFLPNRKELRLGLPPLQALYGEGRMPLS